MSATVAPEVSRAHTEHIPDISSWMFVGDLERSDLYAAGPARIVASPTRHADQPELSLRLTFALSQKIREQTLAGREYRKRKTQVDTRILRLFEDLEVVQKKYEARELKAQKFTARIGNRKPTEKEMAKGKKLVIAMTDAVQFREELKQEIADLMAQAEEAHARYLTCAEQVDSLQFEIFTRCGLMQAYTKARCSNSPSAPDLPLRPPPSNDPSTKHAPTIPDGHTPEQMITMRSESTEAKQARLTLETRSAYTALRKGYEDMDAHRIGYQKALDAYKDIHKAAANVDPREKLGKKHFEEGRRLTQMIAAAGKALDDARDEFAAESLVMIDPEDRCELVFVYDNNKLAEYLKSTVDKDFIETWLRNVFAAAKPNMLSAGWLEAEEEKLRMKKRGAQTDLDDTLHLKKKLREIKSPEGKKRPVAEDCDDATDLRMKKARIGNEAIILTATNIGIEAENEDALHEIQHGDENKISDIEGKTNIHIHNVSPIPKRRRAEPNIYELHENDRAPLSSFLQEKALLCTSERVYGRKKRQIEAWARMREDTRSEHPKFGCVENNKVSRNAVEEQDSSKEA